MAKTNAVWPSCEICFNHFLPYNPESRTSDRRPFIVCSNGHSLCGFCVKRIQETDDEPKCPHCRNNLLQNPIINRDLLKAVESLSTSLGEIEDIDIREIEILGRPFSAGAFADVYKAKWNTTDVAVKALRTLEEMKNQMKLIALEANLAVGLNHPNIIRLFGKTTMLDGRFAIVMELADKGSLEDYRRDMEQQLAIRVFLGIIDGLEYVHSRRVAHRDLKPGNILLSGNNLTPKIADFGLSKHIHTLVTNSAMIGTPKYAPPELLTPKSGYGCSADIFSLAVMLFEVFTGRDAETDLGDNVMQIMLAVVQGLRPKISNNIPGPLKDLISRGWAQSPDARPSLSEFRYVLKCMLNNPVEVSEVTSTNVQVSAVEQATEVASVSFALPIMLMRWSADCEIMHSIQARHQMVEDLRSKSKMAKIINSAVFCAMQVAPRHLFCYSDRLKDFSSVKASQEDLVDLAYTYNRAMPGTCASNESAPEIIGMQLSMTEIIPGQSVLVVGIKGGYIQSLIAQLVGINGRVVTVTSNAEALDVCLERVNKSCPFSTAVSWVFVQDANDPGSICTVMQQKMILFHTIIYCGEVERFPEELIAILHPNTDASIMAPVNDGSNLHFQILTRRQNVQQIKTVTDFSLRFEKVK